MLPKMINIPLPAPGNVTLVISDGDAYQSVEIRRDDIFDYDNTIDRALDYLDAEIIAVDTPGRTLRQLFEVLAEYRNKNNTQEKTWPA